MSVAGAAPTIREATPADARAIAGVHIDVWRTTYRGHFPATVLDGLDLDRWTVRREQRLREPVADQVCLVAEIDGVVVGFADAGPVPDVDPAMGEVYAIYVRDEHQRVGIGRMLLAEAARCLEVFNLRGLLIWVLRENTKGCSFYERMGGRAERERPFEIASVQISEIGYVWDDPTPLMSRSAGGSSGRTQRM